MARALPVDVWEQADNIDGWLSPAEAGLLWKLCAGPWCEVGCWHGRSAVVLAGTGHPGWCVDWFQENHYGLGTREQFDVNLRGRRNVTVVPSPFAEAADRVPAGLALLHLDADHSYEGTAEAFRLYSPKVEVGGHVVIHDAHPYRLARNPWPGTTRFAEELRRAPGWEPAADVERSAAFRRA